MSNTHIFQNHFEHNIDIKANYLLPNYEKPTNEITKST